MSTNARIDRDAPVTGQADVEIRAPAEKVWELLVEIAAWPSWHPEIVGVRYPEHLEPGASFGWQVGRRNLTSTITVIASPHHLAWETPVRGGTVRQAFLIEPHERECHVTVECSVDGLAARLLRRRVQRATDEAQRRWVAALRERAERR